MPEKTYIVNKGSYSVLMDELEYQEHLNNQEQTNANRWE